MVYLAWFCITPLALLARNHPQVNMLFSIMSKQHNAVLAPSHLVKSQSSHKICELLQNMRLHCIILTASELQHSCNMTWQHNDYFF